MARHKRTDDYRDTTIRLTETADNSIATIRGLSHICGYDRCDTQSDAICLAVNKLAGNLKAVIEEKK